MAGKKGKCPACGAIFVAPSAPEPPVAPERKINTPAEEVGQGGAASSDAVFEIIQENKAKSKWKLVLSQDFMMLDCLETNERRRISRSAVEKTVYMSKLYPLPSMLMVKGPGKLNFRLESESYDAIRKWMGESTLLKITLKRRFSWCWPIAILFLLTSIPMSGDPQSGLEAIPFDPISAFLGAGMLLIGLFMRIKPHRALFLMDSAWFLALAGSTIYSIVIFGDSLYWLFVVVLQVLMIVSGVLHYKNFVVNKNG